MARNLEEEELDEAKDDYFQTLPQRRLFFKITTASCRVHELVTPSVRVNSILLQFFYNDNYFVLSKRGFD
jgi:hypothetical protein